MSAATDKLRHRADWLDLTRALREIGLEPEWVYLAARAMHDYEPLCRHDLHSLGVRIKESKIDGYGLYANREFHPGETIMLARRTGKRTQALRYANHSRDPNALFVRVSLDVVDLVALRWIVKFDEITVDYRNTWYLERFETSAAYPPEPA